MKYIHECIPVRGALRSRSVPECLQPGICGTPDIPELRWDICRLTMELLVDPRCFVEDPLFDSPQVDGARGLLCCFGGGHVSRCLAGPVWADLYQPICFVTIMDVGVSLGPWHPYKFIGFYR